MLYSLPFLYFSFTLSNVTKRWRKVFIVLRVAFHSLFLSLVYSCLADDGQCICIGSFFIRTVNMREFFYKHEIYFAHVFVKWAANEMDSVNLNVLFEMRQKSTDEDGSSQRSNMFTFFLFFVFSFFFSFYICDLMSFRDRYSTEFILRLLFLFERFRQMYGVNNCFEKNFTET